MYIDTHTYVHVHLRALTHTYTPCARVPEQPLPPPHVPWEAVPRARLHRCIVGSSSKKPRWALP